MRVYFCLLLLACFHGVATAQPTPPAIPGATAAPLAATPAGVSTAPAIAAQTTPPAAPPTSWSYKGFNFSGYVDTYYSDNFNNPASRASQLQAFNITSDKLSLNSVTGSFSYDPKPVGFRLDIGYGRTYDAFYVSEPRHTDWARYILNAYVSLKPASWKGLQVDFGKFVTSAGAEVTESHLNWNYSRSLLFAYGPYYHFGLRTSAPVRPNWTMGVQLINGWNDILDNNTGKSIGITSVNTFSKVTLANNYYTGPENTGTNSGWRNFYDLAATANLNSKVSAYLNYDVGRNNSPLAGASNFWGIAGAARTAITSRLALTPRFEYYSDAQGFMTGVPQALKEVTLTGEMKLNDSFISRLEWRKDWSNQPYFQVGAIPGHSHQQNLLMASLIVVVKPGLLDFVGKP